MTADEYVKLRKTFRENVLIRGDVYKQSTLEEMNRFLEFIDRRHGFDWVLDGLNVGYRAAVNSPKKPTPYEQARTVYINCHSNLSQAYVISFIFRWPLC